MALNSRFEREEFYIEINAAACATKGVDASIGEKKEATVVAPARLVFPWREKEEGRSRRLLKTQKVLYNSNVYFLVFKSTFYSTESSKRSIFCVADLVEKLLINGIKFDSIA